MSEKPALIKKESVVKLQKVLSLWKSKNGLSQLIERKAVSKKSTEEPSIMLLGRKISKKLIVPNSVEDITITAQRLCEEYIEARLARSGIKEYENHSSTQPEEYSNVLQNIGQILEMKYPKLYTKISSHLKLTYDSEIVVWDSFNKFATNLFSEGITWAKIIALYAFTGGMALDCITHGKNEMPGRIVYWLGVFVMKKLATWIQESGGWGSIVEHFNTDQVGPAFYEDEEESDNELDTKEKVRAFIKTTYERHDNRIKIIGIILLSILFLYVFNKFMVK